MLQGEGHLVNQNQMIMGHTNNPKGTDPMVVEAIPPLTHNCQKGSEDGDIYADSYYF